jgi:hypothetical protein
MEFADATPCPCAGDDTLVVRTLFMPSIATLLWRWFWWPKVVAPAAKTGCHRRLREARTPPRWPCRLSDDCSFKADIHCVSVVGRRIVAGLPCRDRPAPLSTIKSGTDHNRAVQSSDDDTTYRPSRLNAQLLTTSPCDEPLTGFPVPFSHKITRP